MAAFDCTGSAGLGRSPRAERTMPQGLGPPATLGLRDRSTDRRRGLFLGCL